jgi:hypothetical protein
MTHLGYRALFASFVAVALALVPAGAQAISATIVTTVGDAVSIPGNCFKHPYTVTFNMSSDVADATLMVDVTGPLGEYEDAELEFVDPVGGSTQSFSYYVFLCDSDPRGVYTITSKADLYDASYHKTTVLGTPAAFTYSSPAPAPTPEPTVADVDGKVKRLKTYDGRTLKFRLIAFATPAGSVEGAPLRWKFKVDSRVPTKVMQGAGDRYTYSREFNFHSGAHKVVIWKNGIRERTLKINVE